MMRFKEFILVVAFLLILSTGCTEQNEQPLTFSGLPEADEQFIYNVILNSDQSILGTTTMTIKQVDYTGQTALEFRSIDELSGYYNDAKVIVQQSTLLPLQSTVHIKTDEEEWTIEGEYNHEEKKVYIAATSPGSNEKSAEREFETPVLDNAQLLQSIRFLPLAEGYELLLRDMVITSAQTVPCKIVVLGIEELELSDQQIACYHVELRFVGETHEAWYSVDNQVMVKYRNDTTTMQWFYN